MLYHKSVMTSLMLIIAVCMSSITTNAFAADEKWKVRFRGIAIVPDDDSNNATLNGANTGVGVEVDAQAMPELDITYMITPNWGIEAIASMANHDVNVDGTPPAASPLAGLVTNGTKLFDTWVLPPTITLQYHFMPESNIRPYVGVGANYTATLWDDADSGLETLLGPVDVSSENSWGWAVQAGLDYDINDSWFFNVDVKYIDIDTTAKIGFGAGNQIKVDVDIDPFVVGAGIGYRF